MSYVQLGTHQVPNSSNSNHTSAGGPGNDGDGINFPWDSNPNDQNGAFPNFGINWNSNPPPTAKQIEATYEALVNWLKNNTGSPAFYNGSIMLLQMTIDIGQHMGGYSKSDQSQLSGFLANQIKTGKSQNFLQMILQICAQGAAVSSSNNQTGLANATAFLQQIENAVGGLHGAPFDSILSEAQNELDPNNSDYIGSWITAHWGKIVNGEGGYVYTWVDDEGPKANDNTINGAQAMSFEQFTIDAQFALGCAITPSNNASVNASIDAMYQSQINQLVAEFKGNPWALLAALMNLINQRDQDNGTAVNGYGGTLDQIKDLNGIVQKMLGDISGTKPDMADFYKQMQKLKNLALNNPALASVAKQLESDIGTINGQTATIGGDMHWKVDGGYYNFPPSLAGKTVEYTPAGSNKKIEITIPKDGVVYLPKGGSLTYTTCSGLQLTFGQLAAMGDTQEIQRQMESWTKSDANGTGPNWSGTVMSNFENGVTGMQTLLNSPSAAIQAEIQNTTQTMQAEENFEKEAYASITNVNQQVMRLVQSVMG